jgi:hypothetical protein
MIISVSDPFHPSYKKILQRAADLSYTVPSYRVQLLQNGYVVKMTKDGTWDLKDVMWVFAHDGAQEFGLINWKDPSVHPLTLANAPTFTSNVGFAGNGSNKRIDTDWIASTHGVNWTLADCGYEVVTLENTAVTSSYMLGASQLRHNMRRSDGATQISLNRSTTSNVTVASPNSSGHFQHYRTSTGAADEKVRRNGVQIITNGEDASAVPTHIVSLLCWNNSGTKQGFTSRTIQMVSLGGSMSSLTAQNYNNWTEYYSSL